MEKKTLLIGGILGLGAGYLLSKIHLYPETKLFVFNYWKMNGITCNVRALNLKTRKFMEFTAQMKDKEPFEVPLYMPYGNYDISFHFPDCVIKRLNNIKIDGSDINLDLPESAHADLTNDNSVDMAEYQLWYDNYGVTGDPPVMPYVPD